MLFGPARARDTPPRARWRRQGIGGVRGTPVCTNRYARVRPSAPQLNFGDAASYGLDILPTAHPEHVADQVILYSCLAPGQSGADAGVPVARSRASASYTPPTATASAMAKYSST